MKIAYTCSADSKGSNVMANNNENFAAFIRSLKATIAKVRVKRVKTRGSIKFLGIRRFIWRRVRQLAFELPLRSRRFSFAFEKWTEEVDKALIPRSDGGEELDPRNPLRLKDCQSTNHEECDMYGEIWQCARCKRHFCIGEGAADDYYSLCDTCYCIETRSGEIESPEWKSRNYIYGKS